MSGIEAPTIINADCIESMRAMPADSIDAIVTDPPYGLGFMGKEWDDLPPGLDFAIEALRVLKPGGHMLAFGGTRTWHRLAVAVEDAGFEIRDSIAWLYSSGFPKSLDVSKAIDKTAPRAGMFAAFAAHFAERWEWSGLTRRDFVAHFPHYKNPESLMAQLSNWKLAKNVPSRRDFAILSSLLDLPLDRWEPLIARAEAERVKTDERTVPVGHAFAGATYGGDSSSRVIDVTAPATDAARQWQGWGTALKPAFEPIVVARKPPIGTVAQNVMTYGTGALNIDASRIGVAPGRFPANVILDTSQAAVLDGQADGSRFFYCAKAPKSERPVVNGIAHPAVKPLALMQYLVRLVMPPGGVVLDPFAGSGTTVEAALLEGFRVVGIEREATYLPLIKARTTRAAATREAAGNAPIDLALFDDIKEAS